MAGPLRADVEMLNSSIANAGQAIASRHHQQAEEDFRRQQLDLEIARRNAAEQHYEQMEKQQANTADKQQQAELLKEKQGVLNSIMQLNASGQLSNLDDVNDWLANDPHFGQVGLQLKEPNAKPPPQVGQNAVAQALQQADQWRTKAGAETDPANKQRYAGYADMLEKSAAQQTQPKVNTADFDTETTETPGEKGVPEVPAQPSTWLGGFMGIGRPATPAIPAVPPKPGTKITRKIPRAGAAVPATTATGTTADPNLLRQQAQQAIQSGKDPNAVRARYKQVTGQDL